MTTTVPDVLAAPPAAVDSVAVDAARAIELCRRYMSKGRAKLGDLTGGHVEVSSEGAWVSLADGSRYLNAGGYGVFIHGARHPAIEEAVIRQIRTHPLATRLLMEPTAPLAAEALVSVAPEGLAKVHFTGSGAEAAETAIKMARTHGKVRLVSAIGGYHGKTMGALSVTAKDLYQQPFRPLLPDVAHVPFGDAEALESELRNGPDACVIIEPVQSEAGVIVPPAGYVADVARLCRQYGAFFILDEIFTGLGRVGSWWAADREGVSPDVLLAGKGLSGGIVPVAAAVATVDAFRAFDRDPYLHTSTFSGAPIAMAAVRAAIETIAREGLVERAAAIGAHLLDQVRSSAEQRCPHLVREVRGAGLLIGVEMVEAGLAGEMLSELLERRVIVNHSLNAHAVLRLTPPAVLTAAETDHLVTAFDESFRTLADRYPTADRLGDR